MPPACLPLTLMALANATTPDAPLWNVTPHTPPDHIPRERTAYARSHEPLHTRKVHNLNAYMSVSNRMFKNFQYFVYRLNSSSSTTFVGEVMRENAVFGSNLNSGLNVSYLFDLYQGP